MSEDPQAISSDRSFSHALHLMFEGGYRHVPVVDADHRPIGIVSARDVLGLDVLQFKKHLLLRGGLAEIL